MCRRNQSTSTTTARSQACQQSPETRQTPSASKVHCSSHLDAVPCVDDNHILARPKVQHRKHLLCQAAVVAGGCKA